MSSETAESSGYRLDLQEVGRRALVGGLSLGARQLAATLVGIAAGVVLARTLEPALFGIYAVTTFVTRFFAQFTDVGLGAALIRKPRLERDDLSTAFVLQQALMLAAVVFLWASADLWAKSYGIVGASGMIRVLALAFWVSSLGTIPSLVLERDMRFQPLAVCDLVSTVVYHAMAVGLALAGFGVWSFILAALGRSIARVAFLNAVSPWRPQLGFEMVRAREFIAFGLPFQLNKIVTLFKDNIVPTLVAYVSGVSAVGYLNWAQSMAYLPLLVIPILGRVTFPAYSRLQDDPASLRKALERSFRLLALGLYPVAFLLVALAPEVVRFVYTERWMPALPSFYLFSVATIWAVVSFPITNAIYALGRSGVVLKLTIIWTIVGWALAVPLLLALDYVGYAVSIALVSQLSILAVWEMRKLVPVRVLPSIALPLACSAAMGAVIWLARPLVHGIPTLLVMGTAGLIFYALLLAIFGGVAILEEVRPLLSALPGKDRVERLARPLTRRAARWREARRGRIG